MRKMLILKGWDSIQTVQELHKNAVEKYLMECQFADDAALLATTRAGAELAMLQHKCVAGEFGMCGRGIWFECMYCEERMIRNKLEIKYTEGDVVRPIGLNA